MIIVKKDLDYGMVEEKGIEFDSMEDAGIYMNDVGGCFVIEIK